MITAKQPHPYLTGNFAPVKRELPLTQCQVVEGSVPAEVCGGQYVRNGGNPLKDDDEQRQAHWFDGDGMLTGVLFQRDDEKATIRPHFINRYILTDVLLSSSTLPELRRPILPSISTFASPIASAYSLLLLLGHIVRTFILTMLSWLPYQNVPRMKRISAANTSIWWHDGQAFAACESGPPVRVLLPGLETACWWTGEESGRKGSGWAKGYGPIKMINEFTTAHPRVDPISNELLLYHMSFIEPFVRISVIPARGSSAEPLMGAPLPGMRQPKLAHDFCATATKTIFIDLPLSLDPRNLLSGKPMLSYESTMPTRFAIFPRREPGKARWYESQSCCIYHAANAWDAQTTLQDGVTVATTNLVACRLNSATLVYAAGNMDTPAKAKAQDGVEKCQLYYWQFEASNAADRKDKPGQVLREFALSNIPFEFPTMDENRCQTANRFVYGASMTSGSFDAGLGSRCAKIDCLAKVDIASLTSKGIRLMDEGLLRAGEAVDSRTVAGILASENAEDDDIAIFSLPPGHYAQEATFVSRTNAEREDDGFLIFFVFDEHTGLDQDGRCRDDAQSQLWIVDARTMRDVVCKIKLPQRVPYGLHGHFFSEQEIASQRPVSPSEVRNWALAQKGMGGAGMAGTKPGSLVHGHQRVLATISDNIRHHVARLLA